MKSKKLKIMISSTVYGIEELLERIYTLLTAFGYEVWISHKGTMPVCSNKSALENCLKAVEDCDLFLGVITPYYGSSGKDINGLSFTHQEMKRAIELKNHGGYWPMIMLFLHASFSGIWVTKIRRSEQRLL